MTSVEGCGDKLPTEVKDGDQNNVKAGEASEEHPTQNTIATPEKRGRGRGTKRKSDADMMAEAKAVFGDLNTSEGRQLRKRAEPPKVEKKTTPARKASTRKSTTPNSKKAKLDTSETEDKDDEDEDAETKIDDDVSKAAPDKTDGEASLNNGTAADSASPVEEEKKPEEAEKKEEVPVAMTQEADNKVEDSAE